MCSKGPHAEFLVSLSLVEIQSNSVWTRKDYLIRSGVRYVHVFDSPLLAVIQFAFLEI